MVIEAKYIMYSGCVCNECFVVKVSQRSHGAFPICLSKTVGRRA